MINTLIAGGNGVIGTFLDQYLRKSSMITLLSLNNNFNKSSLFKIDLTDKHEVNIYTKSCQKFETLIFLVGLVHSKGNKNDYKSFKKVNCESMINLLSGLKRNNKLPKKIIYTSSISVYGENLKNKIFKEDSIKTPFSPYAITKLEGEDYLLKNFPKRTWILRLAPVYSPHFLLNIHRRIKIWRFYFKIDDGGKKLSLCNIMNIGKVIKSINSGLIPVGIYNISDKKEYTYKDLLEHYNANKIIFIPRFSMIIIYCIGKLFRNIFLIENSIKLLTDNTYCSDKINNYITLNYNLASKNND